MASQDIPVTIIGGYLGVGKTTLLNNLLRSQSGRRLAVLVNDFGSINIDAELIADETGDVISLANGCICCSVGDDLGFALLDVVELEPRPDHIVIEASGIANPARVRGIISMLPKMRVEATVVLAAAAGLRQAAQDGQIGTLIRDQVASADLMILNKCDLASPAALQDTKAWLAASYPDAALLETSHAALPADLILGIKAPLAPAAHDRREAPHSHDHGPEFAHASFETDRLLDRDIFIEVLHALPGNILRGKGFVRFSDGAEGAEAVEILQLVARRWSLAAVAADSNRPQASRLSFIALAEGFDRQGLLDALARAVI